MKYNVPCANKAHGLSTVLAFKTFAKPEDITPENMKLATYLGWCIEMVSFNKLKDIYCSINH